MIKRYFRSLRGAGSREVRLNLIMTAAAVIVLLVLSHQVLQVLERQFHRSAESRLKSLLEAMSDLSGMMGEDSAGRVRTIAENPGLINLAKRILANPERADLLSEFDQWILPIYRSRGFEGYSLIRPDHTILASSSPRYVHTSDLTEPARGALRRALELGIASSRPIISTRPIVTEGTEEAAGKLYQLACARIDAAGQTAGFLCLRTDPYVRLFKILKAGRIGSTGEAYVIDPTARILSPSRFSGPGAAQDLPRQGAVGALWATVPARRPAAAPLVPGGAGAAPTKLAQRLLAERKDAVTVIDGADGDDGYAGYDGYAGRKVIGAGRWLPGLDMGLIVEQQVDEAYQSYFLVRTAIVSLTAIAIGLILALAAFAWRTRRGLSENEERWSAFRENVPTGLAYRNQRGALIMANRAYEQVIGLAPGAAQGVSDWATIPDSPLARILHDMHERVLAGGAPQSQVHTIAQRGGEARIFRVVKFPVREPHEAGIAGVGTVVVEITEQERTRQALQSLTNTLEARVEERTLQLTAAREAAESAARIKAKFLANMSHEIRTPLNAIIGMSHLALNQRQDPDQDSAEKLDRYLGRIHACAAHLLEVVNDILDFSKIEAEKLTIDAREFYVAELLDRVAGLFWETAEAKGIKITISTSPAIPSRLVGDPLRVGQILINFLSNALKFTDHGEVTLRVGETQLRDGRIGLRFEVEDTGVGIAADKLPLLFTPFQQLDSAMNRRFEGTGLGLVISRKLAELMGGSICARSWAGVGSVFSFEVSLGIPAADGASEPGLGHANAPLARPDRQAGRYGLAGPQWQALHGRTVLLVEDNPINQEVARDLLELAGMAVRVAGDGPSALAALKARDFDIVLMDIHMPGMDGVQTTRAIRDSLGLHALPVLALTADAMSADRIRCLEGGMNDHISKPIDAQEMFRTIQAWLPAMASPESADALANAPASAPAIEGAVQAMQAMQAMRAIPGLDVGAGLKCLLDRDDLYLNLARRVCAERAGTVAQIQEALGGGDLDKAGFLAHGMKAILGMLGATALAQACSALEHGLRDGVTDAQALTLLGRDFPALIAAMHSACAMAGPA